MTEDEMAETDAWKLPYGFPIIFAVLNIFLTLTFFPHEPLNFLLKQGDSRKQESLVLLKKVYYVDEKDLNSLYEKLIEVTTPASPPIQKELLRPGFYQSISDARYWRATVMCMLICVFNQGSG